MRKRGSNRAGRNTACANSDRPTEWPGATANASRSNGPERATAQQQDKPTLSCQESITAMAAQPRQPPNARANLQFVPCTGICHVA